MVNHAKVLPDAFHIVDRTTDCLSGEILEPFAVDEMLCGEVAAGRMPIVHLWRHTRAFVVGLRDRRLSHALVAMDHLEEKGYSVGVRHSGGAAVPLDDGVVNISLILPKEPGDMEYNPYFELMYQLLRSTLQSFSLQVEHGEIQGSYCPGDYDLSISGRKFCGLAQRRQTKAFVVQAFVSVEGNAEQRAEIAKQFYTIAAGGDVASAVSVDPMTMISLRQIDARITCESFVTAFIERLRALGGQLLQWDDIQPDKDQIQQLIANLRNRYDNRD